MIKPLKLSLAALGTVGAAAAGFAALIAVDWWRHPVDHYNGKSKQQAAKRQSEFVSLARRQATRDHQQVAAAHAGVGEINVFDDDDPMARGTGVIG